MWIKRMTLSANKWHGETIYISELQKGMDLPCEKEQKQEFHELTVEYTTGETYPGWLLQKQLGI
jgi:hypothetical protein